MEFEPIGTGEFKLKKAEKLVTQTVEKIMNAFWDDYPKKVPKKIQTEPYIRLQFKDSGIAVTVRYHVLATKRNEISTAITRELFNRIRRTNDVEIA